MKRCILFTLITVMLICFYPVSADNYNPDTTNWFIYEYPNTEKIKGGPLDFSGLLDAPAGKHGFLNTTIGDNFYFQDGTEAKFWGINLVARMCYPEKSDAPEIADRIAQSGFNAVRIHLLDSGYADGVWGRKAAFGRVFRDDTMDRFCYLLSELKKRGIYIFLDQNSGRYITADDDFSDLEKIMNGAKDYGYYDEKLIEWQEDYTEKLMNYYNPYTGLCLKDEPAIAMIQFLNEDAIASSDRRESCYYDSQLEKSFNEWLIERYDTRAALQTAWGSKNGLADNEYPSDNTVALPGWTERNRNYSRNRRADSAEFLSEVQEKYYKRRTEHLRSLGVKCLVSGATGWANNGVERTNFYSQLGSDFIDSHQYVSNTQGTVYAENQVRSDSPSSVMSLTYNLVNRVAIRNVYGMPHTVSEWNDYAPNLYRGQSFLMMSAYSALQGVNPFAFDWRDTPDKVTTQTFVKDVLSMNNPETMAAMPAASAIFLRGDVSEAQAGYYPVRLRGAEPFVDYYEYMEPKYKRLFEPYIGYIGKTGMIFDDKAYDENAQSDTVLYLARKSHNENMPYVSVTGELSSDTSNEIFKLNAAKTQAVSGNISNQTIELDDVIVNFSNSCPTMYLTALEDAPIWQSDCLLLTLVGDTRNTGMQLSEDGRTIINPGTAPVLVEPICGSVTLKTTDDVKVYALNSSGERIKEKSVSKTANGYSSFLTEASDKAMHYEIVKLNRNMLMANSHISLGSNVMQPLFTDVPEDSSHYKEITRIALMNCVDYKDLFLPNQNITKRDFIKMLMRTMRLHENEWYSTSTSSFSDLGLNDDGYPEMSVAYNLGIISRVKEGGNWNIKPNAEITRAQAMEYTAKAVAVSYRNLTVPSSFDLEQYSDYYICTQQHNDKLDYFKTVMGLGYLDAINGNISPDVKLTRESAAVIVYRVAWK